MLRALVEEFGGEVTGDIEGVDVTGARLDSRAVQSGDLFCALPGTRADGGAFIEDAASKGAACVLAPAALLRGDALWGQQRHLRPTIMGILA